MLNFIRKHWGVFSALALALLTAAAVATLIVLFPPALPALIGFTAFGVAPFAFLSALSLPAAAAVVSAVAFVASTAISALVNAFGITYNRLDKLITPAPAPRFEELDDLAPAKDTNTNSYGKRFGALLTGCCSKSKKEENENLLMEDEGEHHNPIFSKPVVKQPTQPEVPVVNQATMN